jgi:23S rRNA (cytidine1920-2'-O)/16S rRNA (cytidine1409-2'-O)-methyltransferase
MLLKKGSYMVCLIKPQFEAGREQVGKNGIVKDKKVHVEVIQNVIYYAREAGFKPLKLDYSPIKGAKGNVEFLILLQKNDNDNSSEISNIEEVTERVQKEE